MQLEEEEEEGNSEDEEEDVGSAQQSRAYVPPKVVATPYGMYVQCVTVSVCGGANVFMYSFPRGGGREEGEETAAAETEGSQKFSYPRPPE